MSETKLLRTAGWAAIVAGIAYLTQPVIVFAIDPLSGVVYDESDPSSFYPHPENALSTWYLGSVQAIEFTVVAIAVMLLTAAVALLVRARSEPSPWSRTSEALGWASGIGWLLVAGSGFATHTLAAQSIMDFAVDDEVHKLALQAATLGMASSIALTSVGTAGWLVGLATVGRKAGVVGVPVAVLTIVAGVIMAANVLINPTGVPSFGLVVIPTFIILGIVFLVRARKTKRAGL